MSESVVPQTMRRLQSPLLKRRVDAILLVTLACFMVVQAMCYFRLFPLLAVIPLIVFARWAHLVLHSHSHSPIFVRPAYNAGLDVALTVATGMPPALYKAHHVDTHHRYNNSPNDWTGPFSFKGSSFPDRPVHPVVYVASFLPRAWVGACRHVVRYSTREELARLLTCVASLVVITAGALVYDWQTGLIVVVLPWLLLFWGAAIANWRHHEGCSYSDSLTSANTSIGFFSRSAGFNIGYHAAHHVNPGLHWSELPVAHRALFAGSPN